MNRTCSHSRLLGTFLAWLPMTALGAQCATQWQASDPRPGVQSASMTPGLVGATTLWDPDGAGPLPVRLVVAGEFQTAGGLPALNVAWLDPGTGNLRPFAAGTPEYVRAATALPNGALFVGDSSGVRKWNGSTWNLLPGLSGSVTKMTGLANGSLAVVGNFTTPATDVAIWDGSSWSTTGGGTSGGVRDLAGLPNGDLVVGGTFTSVGGTPAPYVASWNGQAWSALSGGHPGPIFGLEALPNGNLAAAAFGSPVVSIWNGASWSTLPNPPMTGLDEVRAAPTGELFVNSSTRVARWDGASWSSLGEIEYSIFTIGLTPNGDVVAGGHFTQCTDGPLDGIGRWDGNAWQPVGRGLGGRARALLTLRDGDVVIGGDFSQIDGTAANRVARWDGTSWAALGAGLGSVFSNPPLSYNGVHAFAEMPGGDLVAGGAFEVNQNYETVARWDGNAWSPISGPLNQSVDALAVLPNGDLVAGGPFVDHVQRYDGSTWSPLGGGADGRVRALAMLDNGDLVAGGDFITMGGLTARALARFDGATWHPVGNGLWHSSVTALLPLSGDEFVAAGVIPLGGVRSWRVLRWHGTGFQNLGLDMNGPIHALARLPNGDVLAAGEFTTAGGGIPANGVARWDGSAWSAVGAGTTGPALALTHAGNEMFVAGALETAGGVPVGGYAQLVTTCPAAAQSVATACAGPAGPVTLTADGLPWTGSTFVTTATGFATGSLGAAIIGLTPQSLPLTALHPAGLPGCDLLATTDSVQLVVPAGGRAQNSLTIPNDPVLAGLALAHQFVQGEVDALGALTSLSSSNALALVIGAF